MEFKTTSSFDLGKLYFQKGCYEHVQGTSQLKFAVFYNLPE